MSFKKNIFANYIGQGWVALASIAFVPIYIDKLGIEAYGLIGIYTVLQTWLSLLDLGITPTITREMSKLKSGAHSPTTIHNLIFSFELVVFILSTLVLCILLASSGLISKYWISSNLNADLLKDGLKVMSFVIVARFCEGIYRGGLIGLEQHVLLNKYQIILVTFKFGGAAVLVSYYPSIIIFFAWQALISIITIVSLRFALIKHAPPPQGVPKFSLSELSKVKKFASGMTLTNLLGLLFTQTDKLLVTKMESLENFGYYMLSFTIAGIIPMLSYPISSSIGPKLNIAVAEKNNSEELNLFNIGNQITCIVVTPIFTACLFFSYQILFVWTNNQLLSNSSGELLSMIVVGAYCNALLLIPFTLQQAHGWTTLSISTNFIGVLCITLTTLIGLKIDGVFGAAMAWAFSNIIVFTLATIKMHQKLLKSELKKFILNILIKPLSIGIAIAIPTHIFLQQLEKTRLTSFICVLGYISLTAITIATTLPIREQILKTIKTYIKHTK